MGMDGGIKIFSLEEINQRLPEIWNELQKLAKTCGLPYLDWLNEINKSDVEISDLVDFAGGHRYASVWTTKDYKFLAQDVLRLSYGDNVSTECQDLVEVLWDLNIYPLISEETWT